MKIDKPKILSSFDKILDDAHKYRPNNFKSEPKDKEAFEKKAAIVPKDNKFNTSVDNILKASKTARDKL